MERKTLKHSDNAEVESATSESARMAAAQEQGFFLLHDPLPYARSSCVPMGASRQALCLLWPPPPPLNGMESGSTTHHLQTPGSPYA